MGFPSEYKENCGQNSLLKFGRKSNFENKKSKNIVD